MAPTTSAPGRKMTPLAQLFDLAVRNDGQPGLPTYLAASRAPGINWQSYDQIAEYLARLTGRPVNRVTVKKITEQDFMIPDTRYWGGRSQPSAVTRAQFESYELAIVTSAGDVAYVTEVAAPAPDATSDAGADDDGTDIDQ